MRTAEVWQIRAAYAMAAFLVFTPVSEAVAALLPLRPSAFQWRAAATTVLSRALLTPLLGLMLAFAVATAARQRRVLHAVGIIAIVSSTLLVLAMGLFTLDALQLRAALSPAQRSGYDLSGIQVLLKMTFAAVVLTLLAVAAWRSAKTIRSPRASAAASPLLVKGAAVTAGERPT